MLFCSLTQIKIFGTINGSNNDLLLLDIAKNNNHSTNQNRKSNHTQITVAGGKYIKKKKKKWLGESIGRWRPREKRVEIDWERVIKSG